MKRPLLFTLSLCCALTASSAQAQPDPIPERALVNAVEKSDRATVLALLNRGADINKKWINDCQRSGCARRKRQGAALKLSTPIISKSFASCCRKAPTQTAK